MTCVYRIAGDMDYISLMFDCLPQAENIRAFGFEEEALDTRIVPRLNYGFSEPEREGVVTDFPYILNGSTMILSGRAIEALRPWLDRDGVLLPIELRPYHDDDPTAEEVARMEYRMFVCTTVIDALDQERTERFPHEHNEQFIRAYAFHPEAVQGAGIFRCHQVWNRIFATDEVIDAVAAHDLTGLQIQPMWSSDAGPLIRLENPTIVFDRFPPGTGTTLRQKRNLMRKRIARRVAAAAPPGPG